MIRSNDLLREIERQAIMLETIKINNEVIELLQFLWQTVAQGSKVTEDYLVDILDKPAMDVIYTDDFTKQSAQTALSAVVNKEPLNNASKKDEEFFQFNFFNADDPGNCEMLLPVVKQLNVDELKEEFSGDTAFTDVKINFVGAYDQSYWINDNVLTLNFFKLGVDWSDMDNVLLDGTPLKTYIKERLQEMLEK